MVVLPISGFPKIRIDLLNSTKSRITEIVPKIDLPTRHVKPFIINGLF